MPSWLEDWPVLTIYLFFLAGALARSQALYWLGRGVAAGVLRSRWSDRLDHPRVHRATRTIERWGMPIVPLAFLTVGFQSAVFSASGVIRVGWLRFTLWALPGALVWAALWGGGGTAAVAGSIALAARSPWTLAGVVAVAAVAGSVALGVHRRRSRRDSVDALADEVQHDGSTRDTDRRTQTPDDDR